jgi:Ca-activated chloride channel family protein
MKIDANDPRWTAYVLGELADEKSRAEIEAILDESVEARGLVDEIRGAIHLLSEGLHSEPATALTSEHLERIESRMIRNRNLFFLRFRWAIACAVPAILAIAVLLVWHPSANRNAAGLKTINNSTANMQPAQPRGLQAPAAAKEQPAKATKASAALPSASVEKRRAGSLAQVAGTPANVVLPERAAAIPSTPIEPLPEVQTARLPISSDPGKIAVENPIAPQLATPPVLANLSSIMGVLKDASGGVIPGGQIQVKDAATGIVSGAISDEKGAFAFPNLKPGEYKLTASMPAFKTAEISNLMLSPGEKCDLSVTLKVGGMSEVVTVQADASQIRVTGMEQSFTVPATNFQNLPLNGNYAAAPPPLPPGVSGGMIGGVVGGAAAGGQMTGSGSNRQVSNVSVMMDGNSAMKPGANRVGGYNTEAYDHIRDNPFQDAVQNPLSTFSIDVDTASYANMRRFLNNGQLPPMDSVRIEELVNYFSYEYASPNDGKPFAAHFEISDAPWNPDHRLLRIGIKGRELRGNRPPCNLVFLLDVSGSMADANKLSLVKESMRLLVDQLTEDDRVGIVIYATQARVLLPSTRCDQKTIIRTAIDSLAAGGATNGAGGIQLAYDLARRNFLSKGVNRVILATDGDFNVGVTNRGDLTRLIENERKDGIFLSALGFGMGNLKDATLELLADKGDGNYAYIDTLNEARKVLADELDGALVTIAKDTKIQVEFNPAEVNAYRLIGYEDRLMQAEDFNDDTKDAGEIGAGHAVTVLYEIVPVGHSVAAGKVDPLKYQRPAVTATPAARAGELLTLKIRYKEPDGNESMLSEYVVRDSSATFSAASRDFKFAAAVAAFGMFLRNSPYKGSATMEDIQQWAKEGKGADPYGYRQEFIQLLRRAESLHR